MSSKNGNRYKPAFKFKVVLESLRAEGNVWGQGLFPDVFLLGCFYGAVPCPTTTRMIERCCS